MRFFLLLAVCMIGAFSTFAQPCVSLGCADMHTMTTDDSQPDQPSGPEWGCYNGYPRKQTIWQYFFSDLGGYYTQSFACAADLDWLVYDLGTSFAAMNCPVDPTPWTQVGCDLSYNPGGPTGPGIESNVMTVAGHYYAVAIILWEPLNLTFTFGNPQLDSKNLSAANCLVVLPIGTVNLTARPVNGNVVLNWLAGTELNIDRYEIQGSPDGIYWNTGGRTAAVGQAGYQFSYAGAVVAGLRYFRLKIIDKNGKVVFSNIVKIDSKNEPMPKIVDNPVGGVLHIVDLENSGTLRIINVEGKAMLNQRINSATVSIDVSTWQSGLYALQYSNGSKAYVIKFVKK